MIKKLMSSFLQISQNDAEKLQQNDPWFYSHYVYAANVVTSKLSKYIDLGYSQLFDFGCGDGIMALGVSRSVVGGVTGFDVTEAFKDLPQKALETLHLADYPSTLGFVQVDPSKPLPFPDNHFDGGYSWSVFEHVAMIDGTLAEVYRILKPKGVFFLQIEPFYASPFGSHLQRLIDEPWAHLLTDEASYLRRVKASKDTVPDTEKDIMYRENEFENVKNYLIGEYKTLNKLTVNQLLAQILKAGFHVMEMRTTQVNQLAIPPVLLNNYSEYDLRTNEIQLVISK
ncbi:MAG: class I SAM-dependent methyltransferase [Methylovulum sp.]|uniref:class I SAM-dependent methyltransferase n=1 Tax=Methylovulum sp. TaxID=1916980 RepID=UPI00260A541D|nr:class I SAM-dependent methyltransferase [Methylovulum sp.]MDD2725035.1 class I SAM-dependent methyltransferase [Methylovulum sp.]MDD5124246.1 class I SAM-dependent methyltransferase [Methylovulum sp.]